MQIILINSQKGGSGKTMLAKHLSVQAELAGDGPAYLIDNDTQGSLSAWHEKREAEAPIRIDVPFNNLSAGIEAIRKRGASYCFIDTASGRIEVAQELFGLADFVIFPVQPSEDDLTAAPVTVQALKAVGVPFVFVLTRVKAGTLITAQTAAILSRHGEVAPTFVVDRTDYKSPWPNGRTVTEVKVNGPAAQEIAALWKNIKACMHASMHTSNGKVKAHA